MKALLRSALLLLALFVSVPAAATPAWTTYSPAAFEQAQAAGRTIIVDVNATWCPTCRAQAPTLDALRSEPRLGNAVFFKVDFDTQQAFLRQHRVPRQSTILVFRGRRETARSIAETRPAQLRAAILAGTR